MPVTAIVLIYAACALCAVCSFKGHYRDRHAPIGHECEHFYYIPLETVKSKVIKKLIERNLSISKYPEESSSRKAYYLHREYQCMKVLLALIVPCAALDIVLAALGAERIGMGAVLCIFAYIVTYVIFAYVLMCADSERLNSYKYQIRIGEPLFIKSRTASPDKSKLNTLLDVFFFLGEAPIMHSENGNYLTYRLKSDKVIMIILADSFSTMPTHTYSEHEFGRYNHAMAINVKECKIMTEQEWYSAYAAFLE